MLADLLTSTGTCGRPKEHLRTPVLELLTHTPFDLHRWVKSLLSADCTDNGVFGTKFISHFLARALDVVDEGDLRFLRDLTHAPKIIYLHRQDRVGQAISAYVARETKVYFAQTPGKQEQRQAALQELRYDFREIHPIYRSFRNQDLHLQALIERSGLPAIQVNYEDLVENQTGTMSRALRFLEVPVRDDLPNLTTTVVKLRDETTEALAHRFRADLRARGQE